MHDVQDLFRVISYSTCPFITKSTHYYLSYKLLFVFSADWMTAECVWVHVRHFGFLPPCCLPSMIMEECPTTFEHEHTHIYIYISSKKKHAKRMQTHCEFTTKSQCSVDWRNQQWTLAAIKSFIKHADYKLAWASFSEEVMVSHCLIITAS